MTARADGPDPSAAPVPTVGVRYLGHATVLLDLPGIRILTDPFLRRRLGPLRRHGPIPRPGEIGEIDVVAISHAHPDHFDRRSLESLAGHPLVIVPRGMGRMMRRTGLDVREVAIGERVSIAPDRTITAVPARHWRWPGAPTAAAVGYLIEPPEAPEAPEAAEEAEALGSPTRIGRGGIYFAGDTSRYRAMRAFADRVDIALLPVGSWGPHLTAGHLSPRSAAEVARDLDARVVVPIHWGTLFPQRLEHVFGGRLTEPAARFVEWAGRLAPDLDVRALQPGEATTIEF